MKIQELVHLCEGKKVCISGHMNPDGDCIGASLALVCILRKLNIDAHVIMEDIPDTFNYLTEGRQYVVETYDEPDVFIALDCGDKERLGSYGKLYDQATTTINIDHHISNIGYAIYNHVVDASSTCEIIYDMLEGDNLLDTGICEALYTGIVYDTGAFKHCNTTRRTHEIAGILIQYDVNFTEIINRLYYYKSYKAFKILGRAIENTEMAHQNDIIVAALSLEELIQYGCEKKDTDGIVQMLNEVTECKCAVFIIQVSDDTYKISLRSSSAIDVCEVAKAFGGGGHIKAAGCTLTGTLEEVKEQVIASIAKQLS